MAIHPTPNKAEHPAQTDLQAARNLYAAPLDPEVRAALDSDDDDWQQILRTKAPPPKAGYAQRWVRIMTHGVEDVANVMKKRNEGWEPRMADSLPAGFFAPVVQHASLGNVIVNGDMLLMERPLRIHEKQRRHHAKMASLQATAIERYLSQRAPGERGYGAAEVEKFERQVSTGRKPKIADD
jgi:hypothetical protein